VRCAAPSPAAAAAVRCVGTGPVCAALRSAAMGRKHARGAQLAAPSVYVRLLPVCLAPRRVCACVLRACLGHARCNGDIPYLFPHRFTSELILCPSAPRLRAARMPCQSRPPPLSVMRAQCRAALTLLSLLLPPLGLCRCGCAQAGWTPLHYAAQNGQTACVALLVEHGANKDAKDNVRCAAPLSRRRRRCALHPRAATPIAPRAACATSAAAEAPCCAHPCSRILLYRKASRR
jgi:hypothetical protein